MAESLPLCQSDFDPKLRQCRHSSGRRQQQRSPIGELDLSVRLESLRAMFIAPGIPAHLTLDFDLNATNDADLNGGSPIVASIISAAPAWSST